MKSIAKNLLSLSIAPPAVQLIYFGRNVTVSPGFSTTLRSLDFWHDATAQKNEAVWGGNQVQFKRAYGFLPLSEEDTFTLRDEFTVQWNVRLRSSTVLVLDEIKFLFFFSPCYRECFIDEKNFKVPAIGKQWQSFAYEEAASCIGVQCATGHALPDIALRVEQAPDTLTCSCETSPRELNAYVLAWAIARGSAVTLRPRRDFQAAFSIKLYPALGELDRELEQQRKRKYSLASTLSRSKKKVPYTEKPMIVLANPPWESYGKKGVRAGSRWPHLRDDSEGDYLPFPFFLAYATSLLKKHGFSAQIIDAAAEGLNEEAFFEKVTALHPEVLVMETSAPSFYNDRFIAQRISMENIYTVLCGPFAPLYREDFLREQPYVDAVFTGEYELTALEFVAALQKGSPLADVPGMLFCENDRIIKTAPRPAMDINTLPWPERDTLPMPAYRDMPGKIPAPSVQMLSSRGCLFGCDFCLWPQVMFGNSYRARAIGDCVDEMQFLVEKRGFKSVYWDDDTFNIDPVRTAAFADEIHRRGLHAVPWAMMGRSDIMTPQLLEKLKKAGLSAVKYGVENMSPAAQRECGKNLNLKRSEAIVRETKRLGIKVHLTFAFGFDVDTEEYIKKTIDAALNWGPDSVQFSILTPFPGTRLFERLDREGRIATRNWTLYDGHHGCVFLPRQVEPDKIRTLKDYAYRRFFDCQRKKQGITGDFDRFFVYVRQGGFAYAFRKCIAYLKFLLFYRKAFLKNG